MNNGILVNNAYLNAGFEDNGIKGSFNPPSGAICSPVPLPYHLPSYPYPYNVNYNNLVLVFDISVTTGRTISLQFQSGGATVDWGDGNRVVYNVSAGTVVSYTYKDYGTYVVQFISSNYAQILNNFSSLAKLVKILSFGNMNTINYFNAFINASFLNEVPRNLSSSATEITSMLAGASRLNDPNISYWNTSNVLTMSNLFGNCSNFNQSLDNWNVRKVTSFGSAGGLLAGCTNFNSSLSNWQLGLDTSGTDCQRFFQNCVNFNQPLDSWDVSRVNNFTQMFQGCSRFNSSLSGWQLGSGVASTSCVGMFLSCTAFNQDLGSWNVSKVTNMNSMFDTASAFNNGGSPSISGWDTTNNTNLARTFALTAFNQPIGSWNTSNVTAMNQTFSNNLVFNQNIGSWDVSKVTTMPELFATARSFNNGGSPSISGWNTINVTTMNSMFQNCNVFNQSLDNWNVRKVTNFNSMFNLALAFNGSLSGWALGADTLGTTCSSMFFTASNFVGSGLGSWDVSKVTTMSNMFRSSKFNTDISSWNVGNVTSMEAMFSENSSFNQSLNNWNVTKCTTIAGMFDRATSFNGSVSGWAPGASGVGCSCSSLFSLASSFVGSGISSWNVSKVTNMASMFSSASAFQADLSTWNLAGLNANTSLDSFMLNKTGANSYSTVNYDALLIGWNNNKLVGANGVANWRTDLRPNFGGAKYTSGGAAATARAALVTYGWTITDGGVA